MRTDGTWETLPDGQALWRLRIRAPGATSLNLGFTRFQLPRGAVLALYAADGTQAVRPFTAADARHHGQLWTPVVPTDDLVVQVTVPAARRAAVDLELGQIGQGYRAFPAGPRGKSASSGACEMDVECLAADDPWRETMHAVGALSVSGFIFCSGSLVADAAHDYRMFLVTAKHCGISSANAASLVVYWNYQNSSCRTPGSAASGAGGDGSLVQFHTGSTWRAQSATSDFTLVELDDPPVLAFHHYWAGWDSNDGDAVCSNPAEGTCHACSPGAPCAGIHHPEGADKRFTSAVQEIEPASWYGPAPGDGTHLWVHWNPAPTFPPNPALAIPAQATEPGSSGSPLYDSQHRFIGQLHGGDSACGVSGDSLSDYYGRFSVSWPSAAPFLDASGSGVTAVDGYDLLFHDGLEDGSTTAWSASSPP
jgi:hypothetical protein